MDTKLEHSLAQIEQQCARVAAALARGEALKLEAASLALRQAALDLSALLTSAEPSAQFGPLAAAATNHERAQLKMRLGQVAQQIGHQRENLRRRSAVVQRSLEQLIPSLRKPIYSAPSGYRGL